MRGVVALTFGGRDYPLLPTFGVLEKFESRFGSLAKHFVALMDLSAPLKTRAYLLFLGIKAYRDENAGEDGEVRGDLSLDSVAEAMFEEGVLSEEMSLLEVDFMERLLYAPAQYQAKKEQRAILQAEMTKIQGESKASLDLLSRSFNGSPPSSTAAPQESSSPP